MISFAVTAYKETTAKGPSVKDAIKAAVDHPAIDEIVVVDDASGDYHELVKMLYGIPKVKVFRNEKNLGVFGNKLSAVAHCSGDWVINSDSDNQFDAYAIDIVLARELDPQTWYCPSFAKPQFDYRAYIGKYDKSNIRGLVDQAGLAHCFVNTGNQTVHRDSFMAVFEPYLNTRADLMMPNYLNISERRRQDMHWREVFNACDSLIFNYEWVKSGGSLEIVEGFEYEHYYTSGQDSNYNRAPREKGQLNDVLLSKLRELT